MSRNKFGNPSSAEMSSLPFSEYLEECLTSAKERQATETSSRWHSPMFEFLRLAKGHPVLADVDASTALGHLQKWLHHRKWCELFPTLTSEEDGKTEILDSWKKIEFPGGVNPLQQAVQEAELQPIVFFGNDMNELVDYRRFVSLGYWLQQLVGDRAILLPCRRIGEVLGVSHTLISRFRRMAEEQGFLKTITPHRFRGDSQIADATEFRFNLSLFDERRTEKYRQSGRTFR